VLRRAETALASVVAVGVVWVGLATALVASHFPTPAIEFARPLAELTPRLEAGLPRSGPILVEGSGPRAGWLTDAFILQLDRGGFDVVVDDSQTPKSGPQRARSKSEPIAVMTVATGRRIDEIAARPGVSELGRWDPLAPEQRADRVRVEATLREQLVLAGRDDLARVLDIGDGLWEATTVRGVDASLVDQFDRYRRDGYPVAVFVQMVSATPR
jgi:hypothetical protein